MNIRTLIKEMIKEEAAKLLSESLSSSILTRIIRLKGSAVRWGSPQSLVKNLYKHPLTKTIDWNKIPDDVIERFTPAEARKAVLNEYLLFWVSRVEKPNPRGEAGEKTIPAQTLLAITHGKKLLKIASQGKWGSSKEDGEAYGKSGNRYAKLLNTKALSEVSDVVYGFHLPTVMQTYSVNAIRAARADAQKGVVGPINYPKRPGEPYPASKYSSTTVDQAIGINRFEYRNSALQKHNKDIIAANMARYRTIIRNSVSGDADSILKSIITTSTYSIMQAGKESIRGKFPATSNGDARAYDFVNYVNHRVSDGFRAYQEYQQEMKRAAAAEADSDKEGHDRSSYYKDSAQGALLKLRDILVTLEKVDIDKPRTWGSY